LPSDQHAPILGDHLEIGNTARRGKSFFRKSITFCAWRDGVGVKIWRVTFVFLSTRHGGIDPRRTGASTMQSQPQPQKINVNGAELTYIQQGEGVPVVLVHGSLGDFRAWGLQLEPFSQRYRVIAYSRRYHYPNAWTGDGSDYSTALHAADLAALITELGLGPAHIVAGSFGAYVALLVALRYPARVRALALVEPPLLPWLRNIPGGEPALAAFMTNAWEPARQAFARGELEQGIRLFFNGVLGPGVFDQLPEPVRASLLDNAPEMKAETSATELFSTFSCEDAQRIKVPVLLLTGERSPKIFRLITDELARCLPRAERVMIPDASHAISADNPPAYNEAVLAFLARHASS
jgi:pimeloyl-ACP methyl ester carboxylesterase